MKEIKNNEEKAVCMSLQVRDLCVEKGVTRDNAETASLLVQQAALQMAEWKDKQFQEEKKQLIEKACDYLYNNIDKNLVIYHNNTWLKRDEFVKRFKKTMEE